MYQKGERTACIICDYWWLILLLIVLALAIYLSRNIWGPELFPETWPTEAVVESAPETLSSGDVQVVLRWEGTSDIDLHVIEPSGEEIAFQNTESGTNGQLEVDANAGCSTVMDNPVENIYWPLGTAPEGEYEIIVVYYANCGDELATPFTVELLVDGESFIYHDELSTVEQSISINSFER